MAQWHNGAIGQRDNGTKGPPIRPIITIIPQIKPIRPPVRPITPPIRPPIRALIRLIRLPI